MIEGKQERVAARRTCRLVVLLCCLLSGASTSAAPYVPPALQPWVDWVLHEHPELKCPRAFDTGKPAACAWVSRLDVEVAADLEFRMNVQIHAQTRIRLPGDRGLWPSQVRVDGEPAVVTGDAYPLVGLEPGAHDVAGRLTWTQRPNAVTVPPQFGLLGLTVDGEPVTRPGVSGDRLFLGKSQADTEAVARDSLKADVFRLVRDNYPLEMRTTVELTVAGRPRLETLGRLLLDGFEVVGFSSPLPARLDAAGNLQIQVEAGEHTVEVEARATRAHTELGMTAATDNWPQQEVWGFQPMRDLRLVTLSGAPPIDLRLARAPFDEGVQGFLLSPDQVLAITVEQRGNPNPTPNRFALVRDLWLNFDGDGYVVRDQLTADLNQASRLSASYPLGRIDVDGASELVNTLAGSEPGIELQTGSYRILSVSTLPEGERLTATGWRVDAQSLEGILHLPPGWRLLWAGGADDAPGAWLSQWSLWDVFVLVLAGVIAWRYLSRAFAALLLGTMVLMFQADGLLAVAWLVATGLVAGVRHINHARALRLTRGLAWVWLTGTALATISFAVDHTQQALHPQLEPHMEAGPPGRDFALPPAQLLGKTSALRADQPVSAPSPASEQVIEEVVVTGARVPRPKYDENLQIQTGPGLPQWSWRQAALRWTGPVAMDQPLNLVVLSPAWIRIVNAVVTAFALIVVGVLIVSMVPELDLRRRLPRWVGALLPMLVLAWMPTKDVDAAEITPDLLEALEQRLTEVPSCFPQCASVERASINLDDGTLVVDLLVHAGAFVSLPLPVSDDWQPGEVSVDGAAATLSAEQVNDLRVALAQGIHRVRLAGGVDQLERFELSFPIQPGRAIVEAMPGWQTTGLVEGRVARGTLGFERDAERAGGSRSESLKPDTPLPFVQVQREIEFALEWRMTTTVERLAPAAGGFTVDVALLPDEAVLDESINVEDGRARLVFGARDRRLRWQSTLSPSASFTLTAAPLADRRERWVLLPTNLWHVTHDGIYPIASRNPGPVFQPEAGETLEVQALATTPIPGDTVTLEQLAYEVTPGDRLQNHVLRFDLRASQGGTYPLALPAADNTLASVSINGADTPIPLLENMLALPQQPGEVSYRVEWTSSEPLRLLFRMPQPELASPLNNITTSATFPRDRWVLLLGGPALGPAMLYWGVLAVVLLLALVLARVPGIPLTRWDVVLLSLGLSLCNLPATVLVAVWVLALRFRGQLLERLHRRWLKNSVQVLAALLSVATLLTLIGSVPAALLGSPEMQIVGNGSGPYFYNWFTDHAGLEVPSAWVLSLPIWVYRLAMLAWSLWLAFALIRWMQWAWQLWIVPRAWYGREPSDAARPAGPAEPGEGAW